MNRPSNAPNPFHHVMNFIENILGQALSQLAGGQQNQLFQAAANLIPQHGGLDGLQQRFESQGLGHIFASWIGTGQNQPISPTQITQVLGHDQVQQLADQAGVSHGDAAAGLAHLLPNLVDKLTPSGTSVSGGILQQGLASLLQGGLHSLFSK
jgi:uncharacterized protein YidB (DUF937 family)